MKLRPKEPHFLGGRNAREERRMWGEFKAVNGTDPSGDRYERVAMTPRREKKVFKKCEAGKPLGRAETRFFRYWQAEEAAAWESRTLAYAR